MIHTIQPLYAGNALRLFMSPPAGAVLWRVLRKGSDTFTGHDDSSALVAYEGTEKVWLDFESLTNDVAAFYKPYYQDSAGAWTAGTTSHGTPTATYKDNTTDVVGVVRDRLERGLKVECDRGNLVTDLGYVQVMIASPIFENVKFPLVTIHVENQEPEAHGIGDILDNENGFSFNDERGFLRNVGLTIIAWSLNGDERKHLRDAISAILQANRDVFDAAGVVQITWSQSDIDAVNGEYPAPIFQAMTNLSCVAPVRVGGVDEGAPVAEDILIGGH